MTGPHSRAHRRILGWVPSPHTLTPHHEYYPIGKMILPPNHLRVFEEHLSTVNGQHGRCGILLGWRERETLHVFAILGAGYPNNPSSPLELNNSYILGAIEALQYGSTQQVDWVGTWVTTPDALAPTVDWIQDVWNQASRQALVTDDYVLVTVGKGNEKIEVEALVADDGQPRSVKVSTHRQTPQTP